MSALAAGNAHRAWRAFGRLTHAAQELYAHSNYISLWLARFGDAWPPPEEIEPLEAGILNSPDLRSGILYFPLETMSFIPGLKPLIMRFLPRDSHAWMNLDSPARGAKFAYVFVAAVKSTITQFEQTVADFSLEMKTLFTDR